VIGYEEDMAQKNTSLAYAQALLELATEPWLKGLRLTARRLRDMGLAEKLADPAMPEADKWAVLAPAVADAPPQVMAFVRSLASSGDLNKLDTIVSEFESLIVRRSQYLLAHVRSAVPLTDDERAKLEENLSKRFGAAVETEYQIDPALLGGVVVRVGDEVIDGSLAGKLAALREKLV
jgi:F-type H+-transporting ATPase subunit delta